MVPGLLEWCNLELQHQEVLVRVPFQLYWLLKCPLCNAIVELMEVKEFVNFGKIVLKCSNSMNCFCTLVLGDGLRNLVLFMMPIKVLSF